MLANSFFNLCVDRFRYTLTDLCIKQTYNS